MHKVLWILSFLIKLICSDSILFYLLPNPFLSLYKFPNLSIQSLDNFTCKLDAVVEIFIIFLIYLGKSLAKVGIFLS